MARSKKTKPTQQPNQAPTSPTIPTPASPEPEEPPQTVKSTQDQQVPAQSQPQEESPQLMKKGIYLSALVYIEGMQAPAEDFAALAKAALAEALEGEHKGLTITLKNTHVENNVEDTEDGGDETSKKGGFEF